jgi:hypothetical protein
MGVLNVWRDARHPRSHPERLANTFLAAIHNRDLNKAAYLVTYDDRYAFLSDSPSWILLDYDLIEAREDAIRYRHTSEVDGRRVSGESFLPVVRNGDRYWIGHIVLPDKTSSP